jgi:glutaredoxin 3
MSGTRVLNKLKSLLRKSPEARGSSGGTTPAAYRPAQVRLFIKPYCPWCRQAMDWLDERSVSYAVLDVIKDRAAYDEMFRLSGQTLAPVIDVDGQILADFGARELAEFWRKLERQPPKPSS